MDTNTRKLAAIIGKLGFFFLISSCSNTDYSHEVRVDGTKGRFFVAKSGTAIALSDDMDSVDYEVGPKKLRIFTGTGGKSLSVRFDDTTDLILVSYCGGRIEKVESSFVDTLSTDEKGWKIYRIQVINNPGFTYGGAPVCP